MRRRAGIRNLWGEYSCLVIYLVALSRLGRKSHHFGSVGVVVMDICQLPLRLLAVNYRH